MAGSKILRPSVQCLRQVARSDARQRFAATSRSFTTSTPVSTPEVTESTSSTPSSEDAAVAGSKGGAAPPYFSKRTKDITPGSRRRKAALDSGDNIPFELLPYHCFQEARKVLLADREEKLAQIEDQRGRIARLKEQDVEISGGQREKERRLGDMNKYLEKLKILADINDPVVKKRFEDGLGSSLLFSMPFLNSMPFPCLLHLRVHTDCHPPGDMNRPIYRHLALQKWTSSPVGLPLITQRIHQMSVIPDVIPHMTPTSEVSLSFWRRNVAPGDFVDSRVSEISPKIKVQVFDQGERLVSVAVVDSDVPDIENDGFRYRCHFLATNIKVNPEQGTILTHALEEGQNVLEWLPPAAQKGAPYHRLSTFILQQPEGVVLPSASLSETVKRDDFNLRSFIGKHSLSPIGVHMFRAKWDEGSAGVMERSGISGGDVEFKAKHIPSVLKVNEERKPKERRRSDLHWGRRRRG
jgi:large subunit ribosomal protein L35